LKKIAREGKIHGIASLLGPEQEEVEKTLCGLTPERCPGEVIEGGDDEVTCKTCMAKLAAPIKWFCWPYDKAPEWSGYVGEERRYRVSRGKWLVVDLPNEGGTCHDDDEGKEHCLEHYRADREKRI
jgi:hypothetical protein